MCQASTSQLDVSVCRGSGLGQVQVYHGCRDNPAGQGTMEEGSEGDRGEQEKEGRGRGGEDWGNVDAESRADMETWERWCEVGFQA
jgi:hypothetical protein